MNPQTKHSFVKRLAVPLAVAALAAPAAQARIDGPPSNPPKSDAESPALFHQLRRTAPDGTAPTVYTTSPTSATATATDWVDRGFGIGAAVGAVVVATGLGLSARKARREATA
ncbi:MAG TPA: hypothetical protein VH650_08430 [Gaiellaceae bacterium]|jgi:hypothetical protein